MIMAAYVGTTVRIKATVTDFDGKPVTSATSATVDLYDTSGNYVFTAQPLSWEPVDLYWYYDWQDALTGNWIAKCTFTGTNFEVFDYGTVRVKALKVTPTGNPTP